MISNHSRFVKPETYQENSNPKANDSTRSPKVNHYNIVRATPVKSPNTSMIVKPHFEGHAAPLKKDQPQVPIMNPERKQPMI